jgi:hypothetical protein
VIILMGYGLVSEGVGVRFLGGEKYFFVSTSSRLSLGLMQSPIQWVWGGGGVYPGLGRGGV